MRGVTLPGCHPMIADLASITFSLSPCEPVARQAAKLQDQLRRWESFRPVDEVEVVSTGAAALDALLPRRGLARGSLVEWLSPDAGAGATSLAFAAAALACADRGLLVVIDRERQFYPPAAIAWGIDCQQIVVVRPHANQSDDWLWALEQSLRSRAAAVVWAWCDELDPQAFRRLQLAAESGGSIGMLFRPIAMRGQPSWADVQLIVEPQSSLEESRAIVNNPLAAKLPPANRLSTNTLSWKNSSIESHNSNFPLIHKRNVFVDNVFVDKESPPNHLRQGQPVAAMATERRWEVRLGRCRQGSSTGTASLVIDDLTGKITSPQEPVSHARLPLHRTYQLATAAAAS